MIGKASRGEDVRFTDSHGECPMTKGSWASAYREPTPNNAQSRLIQGCAHPATYMRRSTQRVAAIVEMAAASASNAWRRLHPDLVPSPSSGSLRRRTANWLEAE